MAKIISDARVTAMKVVRCQDQAYAGLYTSFHRQQPYTALYSLLDLEYSRAYTSSSEFVDMSFLIENGGRAVLVFVASLRNIGGINELSAFGRPVFFVEDVSQTRETLKHAHRMFKGEIARILSQHKISKMQYVDYLADAHLSPLSVQLMDLGAIAGPHFSQIVDLTLPEENIRRETRKSYKSLINWGTKNLDLRVWDSGSTSEARMEEFQRLHVEVAGKETRSAETWAVQHRQVMAREAYVIAGYLSGRLVTAALFLHNEVTCYYGVSASDRKLFDKPMAHAVIWLGISHAKLLGCRFFEVGEQLYPKQKHPVPSEKELGISKFKRGFGGETCARIHVSLDYLGVA